MESAVPVFLMLFFHLLSMAVPGGGNSTEDTHFVSVDVSMADTLLQPGGKGKILVSFSPVDGIHINVDPPVGVKVEKNPLISLHGDPDITTDKETGFLSTSTPVGQRFSVSRKATPGEHIVQGTIIYYFCSDTEGWCRKQSREVSFRLNIRRP